jgi:ribosome-associated heat shock protein Hsp15
MDGQEVRIDKWLWAVRVFKSRSLAADACKGGKVSISNGVTKASRDVKINDVITIHMGQYIKTVQVLKLLHNRVSAKLVPEYMTDLTPPAEYEKIEIRRAAAFVYRPRGTGRPTKKDRRDIDKLY